MVRIIEADSTSNCLDMDFIESYIDKDVITGNLSPFEENGGFLTVVRSAANQFDVALRKLAD